MGRWWTRRKSRFRRAQRMPSIRLRRRRRGPASSGGATTPSRLRALTQVAAPDILTRIRGRSSVGRAPASQATRSAVADAGGFRCQGLSRPSASGHQAASEGFGTTGGTVAAWRLPVQTPAKVRFVRGGGVRDRRGSRISVPTGVGFFGTPILVQRGTANSGDPCLDYRSFRLHLVPDGVQIEVAPDSPWSDPEEGSQRVVDGPRQSSELAGAPARAGTVPELLEPWR